MSIYVKRGIVIPIISCKHCYPVLRQESTCSAGWNRTVPNVCSKNFKRHRSAAISLGLEFDLKATEVINDVIDFVNGLLYVTIIFTLSYAMKYDTMRNSLQLCYGDKQIDCNENVTREQIYQGYYSDPIAGLTFNPTVVTLRTNYVIPHKYLVPVCEGFNYGDIPTTTPATTYPNITPPNITRPPYLSVPPIMTLGPYLNLPSTTGKRCFDPKYAAALGGCMSANLGGDAETLARCKESDPDNTGYSGYPTQPPIIQSDCSNSIFVSIDRDTAVANLVRNAGIVIPGIDEQDILADLENVFSIVSVKIASYMSKLNEKGFYMDCPTNQYTTKPPKKTMGIL